MKPFTPLLLSLLLTAPTGASLAEPLAAFQPMAFLAGHCYRGELNKPGQTDTHCFAWLYGGKALRDTHTVRTPNRPDFGGETTYYYDSAAKTINYVYIEDTGGISRGTVESAPGALVFPASQYINDGETMTLRVRWTLQGEDAYEAFSEAQGKDGAWATLFKVAFKRTAK